MYPKFVELVIQVLLATINDKFKTIKKTNGWWEPYGFPPTKSISFFNFLLAGMPRRIPDYPDAFAP